MTNDESWPQADDHPTEPLAPEGAVATEAEPTPEPDWQAKYESEQRRARIFMATTAAAVAAFLAAAVFAIAQAGDDSREFPGGGPGEHRGFEHSRGFDDDHEFPEQGVAPQGTMPG